MAYVPCVYAHGTEAFDGIGRTCAYERSYCRRNEYISVVYPHTKEARVGFEKEKKKNLNCADHTA